MAGSYVVTVPAGSQSLVQSVTPLTNIAAGPQVLGGTVLVETAPTPQGPWTAWSLGSATNSGSARLSQNGYARVTATTQNATAVFSDFSGCNNALSGALATMVNSNAVFATPSTASAVNVFSFRIPPLFLPLNFKIGIEGTLNLSNNANVKTLNLLMNGASGTNFASYAVTSFASFNFYATLFGSDGQNMKGSIGATLSAGLGGSTTAISTSTLTRDYINNETEIVISATKATAGDTFELHSLRVTLSL